MKITMHISFYYLENRLQYINKIIDETNIYNYSTDIFIHTNNINLTTSQLKTYINGDITIIYHDLSNIHPFYLTWKCRDLLYKQRFDYDIFIYIEDDILVPNKAIEYWLQYNKEAIEHNYNLGFLRIEIDNTNTEYITDLYNEKFDKSQIVNNKLYCVNNKNPYCAFWIYNKKEFNKFVESSYYDINNIIGYDIREKSAIGLHGINTNWYKGTIIPIIDNKLHDDCRIYHLPNNYVNDTNSIFATIKFNDCI
jgi:hypothetical protein